MCEYVYYIRVVIVDIKSGRAIMHAPRGCKLIFTNLEMTVRFYGNASSHCLSAILIYGVRLLGIFDILYDYEDASWLIWPCRKVASIRTEKLNVRITREDFLLTQKSFDLCFFFYHFRSVFIPIVIFSQLGHYDRFYVEWK